MKGKKKLQKEISKLIQHGAYVVLSIIYNPENDESIVYLNNKKYEVKGMFFEKETL